MTLQEAVDYIEKYTWSTTRLGLERTHELLAKLGNPQKSLKFVHVAGSNGKGSTCAMLASILKEAGYKTGLYTSPHIMDFRERIQINGEYISGEELAEVTEAVSKIAERMKDHPSQFELSTAVAIEHFAREKCDIVVLEVGLGGSLDSTNAIDAPEVAVIANIGLEHTEYLGDTIEEIALAKAGIIKPGCRAVCYDGAREVTEVVYHRCKELGVPLTCADSSLAVLTDRSIHRCRQQFTWRGEPLTLGLLGTHQLKNVSLALTAIEVLREAKWDISPAAISRGLAQVKWPARCEVLCDDPLFILDGGHNPQCAETVAAFAEQHFSEQEVTFLMGVLSDKDYRKMLRLVIPHAKRFVCITPECPRALAGEDLTKIIIDEFGMEAVFCESAEKAIYESIKIGNPVIAFGSLYMAGALRRAVPSVYKNAQRKKCLASRQAMTAEERAAAEHAICERLKTIPAVQNAKRVLSYMATYDEANLCELHDWIGKRGAQIAFPVSYKAGRMVAYVPFSEDCIEIGKYDILSPIPACSEKNEPEEFDLVLVPCVGFDAKCGRLGHGGGYYDRYLPQCSNATLIMVAFESQRVEKVVLDQYDYPIHTVVTEDNLFICRQE